METLTSGNETAGVNYDSDSDDSDGFKTPPEEIPMETSQGAGHGNNVGSLVEEDMGQWCNEVRGGDSPPNESVKKEVTDNQKELFTFKQDGTGNNTTGGFTTRHVVIDHDAAKGYNVSTSSATDSDLQSDRYLASSLYQGYMAMMQCQQSNDAEGKYHATLAHLAQDRDSLQGWEEVGYEQNAQNPSLTVEKDGGEEEGSNEGKIEIPSLATRKEITNENSDSLQNEDKGDEENGNEENRDEENGNKEERNEKNGNEKEGNEEKVNNEKGDEEIKSDKKKDENRDEDNENVENDNSRDGDKEIRSDKKKDKNWDEENEDVENDNEGNRDEENRNDENENRIEENRDEVKEDEEIGSDKKGDEETKVKIPSLASEKANDSLQDEGKISLATEKEATERIDGDSLQDESRRESEEKVGLAPKQDNDLLQGLEDKGTAQMDKDSLQGLEDKGAAQVDERMGITGSDKEEDTDKSEGTPPLLSGEGESVITMSATTSGVSDHPQCLDNMTTVTENDRYLANSLFLSYRLLMNRKALNNCEELYQYVLASDERTCERGTDVGRTLLETPKEVDPDALADSDGQKEAGKALETPKEIVDSVDEEIKDPCTLYMKGMVSGECVEGKESIEGVVSGESMEGVVSGESVEGVVSDESVEGVVITSEQHYKEEEIDGTEVVEGLSSRQEFVQETVECVMDDGLVGSLVLESPPIIGIGSTLPPDELSSDSDEVATPSLESVLPVNVHEKLLAITVDTKATPTTAVMIDSGGASETKRTFSESGVNTNAPPTLTDAAINTEFIVNTDSSTNTDSASTKDSASLARTECQDAGSNTDVSMFELLKQVHSNEQYLRMEEELKLKSIELNDEKSKRMVNDNLVSILQSDLVSLQQRHVDESSDRIRLDGEIAELKAELEHSQKEVKEKEQRITELDESLSGTLLLVRKLEEQSAVMTNKGGVDYLLQAKISDGRAHEAEQKLQVLQADLLQSQAEVQRLLDRLSEFSREKREMVSSQVHTQLLQISDERAEMAERKVMELEQEIMHLKATRAHPSHVQGANHSMLGTYPGSSPSPYGLHPYPTYRSPYSSTYSGIDYKGTSSSYGSDTAFDSHLGASTTSGISGGDLSSYSSFGLSSGSTLTSSYASSYLGGPKLDEPGGVGLGVKVLPVVSAASTSLLPDHTPLSFKPSVTKPEVASKPVVGLPSTGLTGVSLPSVVPSTSIATASAPPPAVPGNSTGVDDDSSDWTSSEDDEPQKGVADSGSAPLRPTSHMNLKSKWEWLSQQKDEPSTATPLRKQPRPPPIAPKPKILSKTHATVLHESPVTFDEPPVKPKLQSFRRPSGPLGRRPPSRTSLDDFS